MRNTLLSWSSKSAYTCVLNKYWLLLLFWNTSLFFFFFLFLSCFHYISPLKFRFSLGFHPFISLWTPSWVLSFFLGSPPKYLLLVSQSFSDISKYSGNPKSINWIQYFALKPALSLLFCILLTILCWSLTIAMSRNQTDLGSHPSFTYVSCETLGDSESQSVSCSVMSDSLWPHGL